MQLINLDSERSKFKMKKPGFLILMLVTFFGMSSGAFAQYTVSISVNDWWWESKENFGADLVATIYYNGQPISNSKSSNYFYWWHVYFSNNGGYWVVWDGTPAGGYGGNEAIPETDPLNSFYAYVVVTDTANHTFTDISSPQTQSFSMPSQGGWPVSFSPLQQNGQAISGVTANHWRWTIDQWKSGYNNILTLNYNETIQSSPNYTSSYGQKLRYWNGDQTNITNYNTFYINSGVSTLQPTYWSVDGTATVTTSVIDAGNASGGIVSFMDPWLVDYPQLRGVDRSEGMSAPFKSRQAPFHPDLSTSYDGDVYNGIFQQQSGPPSWNPPYYSVSVPMVQTINGYTAFFAGWTCSPAGSASFEYPTSTSTPVEFVSSGATVIAQYKYYTVTYNTTVPSGTWPMAGSVTVPSGVTLTGSSGATLQFPSSTGLTVNGVLSASGDTFTASSGTWNGITLNADNSSLTNCTISSASSPLSINNVNTATISGGAINNSTFSSSQAILVSNSTPIITGLTISGQSGSTNGVRYTNGRGGTISQSTIQNCGLGNGIVIQGNSSPTINGCTISSNYYYGIIVSSNGSATPTIQGNSISSNGTGTYPGLVFLSQSTGLVIGNTISGSYGGIGCYGGSYPSSGRSGQKGSNTITSNSYGIICGDAGSIVEFGSYDGKYYYGTCNSIYGNTYYDAYATGGGGITAEYDWWGQYPPNSSKFYVGSGSSIDYNNALTSLSNCPIGGSIAQKATKPAASVSSVGLLPSGAPDTLFQIGDNAFMNKDYGTAASAYRSILKGNATVAEKHRALVRLCNTFMQSGNTTIISDLKIYSANGGELGEAAEELLANAYAATKQTSNAQSLANDLIAKYPGTDIEKRALILLTSLRAFDPSADAVSSAALNQLKTRFGSSLDAGLIAALTAASDVPSRNMNGKIGVDAISNATGKFEIENYPNPFNPSTMIRYALPVGSHVTIKIYDALGREVSTLVNEDESAGYHKVVFDASRLASGVYFYRITAGSYTSVKKLMLVK